MSTLVTMLGARITEIPTQHARPKYMCPLFITMFEMLWSCGDAEFHGERIVEMHMQRLGGKEQLLAQVYSAIATRRDDTVELALRAYGAPEP